MLKNITIRTRLILAFGLLLVLMLVNSISSYVAISQLNGKVTELSTNRMPRWSRPTSLSTTSTSTPGPSVIYT
ncbi:Tar ligand binding domain-containing protein [Desulfosarcina cetonica]|uniref:Tar ligand binding domain-containing protein n=1 Tax=Desulfosarcina cetonica TaxID=90730 RepID=UPI0009F96173